MNQEILDIVNEHDEVIESKSRDEIYKRGNCFIRGVWLFIQNSKGQLWIPRRVKTKALCPEALDGSVVGHINAGETYEDAVIRETKEEVNLKIKKEDLKCIGSMRPEQLAVMSKNIRAFIKVYLVESDDVPDFNRDDFSEYYWLKPEELLSRIESGEKHKPSLPLVVKHIFKRP